MLSYLEENLGEQKMKLKSEETKDLKGFKHKIKRGENYFLTIFDDSGIKTINISKLNKKLITFGNGKNNDITISSDIIATRQGYFEITEYGVLAVNTTKGIFMKGTDNRIYDEIYLAEGSFIKITSRDNDSTKGILIVMSIGRNLNEWKEYSLKLGRNTLGSEKNNDIVLPSKGIAKKHASIYYFRNNITIADEGSLNGIYINRKKILPAKNKKIAAVTSTGLEGIKISDFFSKYLYPVISQYKLSFVLFEKNAWNQEKHYFIPVPGHPASEDFIRFVSYPDILTCDDIKK